MNLLFQKETCFAGGISICLQRDVENLFLFLGLPFPLQGPAEEEPASPRAPCCRKKHCRTHRGTSCFVSQEEDQQAQNFQPRAHEPSLWLIEQLLFAWCVKEQRDGPYSLKATSLDNFVVFKCMWTSNYLFQRVIIWNGCITWTKIKKGKRQLQQTCKWENSSSNIFRLTKF